MPVAMVTGVIEIGRTPAHPSGAWREPGPRSVLHVVRPHRLMTQVTLRSRRSGWSASKPVGGTRHPARSMSGAGRSGSTTAMLGPAGVRRVNAINPLPPGKAPRADGVIPPAVPTPTAASTNRLTMRAELLNVTRVSHSPAPASVTRVHAQFVETPRAARLLENYSPVSASSVNQSGRTIACSSNHSLGQRDAGTSPGNSCVVSRVRGYRSGRRSPRGLWRFWS
jgi:hypothetical protein